MATIGTRIVTIVVAASLVIAIVCVLRLNAPLLAQYKALNEERSELQSQNAEMKAKLADIRRRQERVESDRDFVATIAHENRLSFPDETIFTFDVPAE